MRGWDLRGGLGKECIGLMEREIKNVLSLCFYIAWRWATQEEEQNYLSGDDILGMFSVRCWRGFNWMHEFGEQKMSILEMLIWN